MNTNKVSLMTNIIGTYWYTHLNICAVYFICSFETTEINKIIN